VDPLPFPFRLSSIPLTPISTHSTPANPLSLPPGGTCDGDIYACCDNGCAFISEQCCDPLSVYCPSQLYCPTARIDAGQQLYCYTDSARQTTAALAFSVIDPAAISAVASATATLSQTVVAGPTGTTLSPSGGASTSSSKAAAPGSAFEAVRLDIPVLVMLLAGLGMVLL